MRPLLRFAVLLLLPAGPALAQAPADSGVFVIRLGVDTLGLERFVRSGDRIESTLLTRSPRTAVRRLSFRLGPDGSVTHSGMAPLNQPLEERPVAVAGAIPLLAASWVPWELVLRRAQAAGTDSVTVAVLTGGANRPTPVRRTGPGRFELANQFDQAMTARVDAQGRLLRAELAGGGTSVERVAGLDLERWIREFAQRDTSGTGLGPLSPRDSVSIVVQGATVKLEYGRPSLRGRPLEVLVPPGAVWRMGANDATILSTDRPLRFQGLLLAPGSYSLFALPEAAGWTLLVNRQTRMSGLDRDAAQDLGRVPMRTRAGAAATERLTLELRPQGNGGGLVVRWATLEAVATFEVERPE